MLNQHRQYFNAISKFFSSLTFIWSWKTLKICQSVGKKLKSQRRLPFATSKFWCQINIERAHWVNISQYNTICHVIETRLWLHGLFLIFVVYTTIVAWPGSKFEGEQDQNGGGVRANEALYTSKISENKNIVSTFPEIRKFPKEKCHLWIFKQG